MHLSYPGLALPSHQVLNQWFRPWLCISATPLEHHFSPNVAVYWSACLASCIRVENQYKYLAEVTHSLLNKGQKANWWQGWKYKKRSSDLRINFFNLQATLAWINRGNNSSASGLSHFSDQVMCPSSVAVTFVGSKYQFPPPCHLPNNFCPWEKVIKYDKDDNHN